MSVLIQLIRHGRTTGNLEKRFTGGRTDDSLCDEGIIEIKKFTAENIYSDCDIVFASPMKRCVETAEIIWPKKKINTIEELREIDFGLFENRNHEELNGNPEYQKWLDSNGKGDIPSGEKYGDFAKRAMAGFNKMLSMTDARKIAMAVHGGTIMAIISVINGGDFYDYICKNGRGYLLEYSVEEKKLISLRKI